MKRLLLLPLALAALSVIAAAPPDRPKSDIPSFRDVLAPAPVPAPTVKPPAPIREIPPHAEPGPEPAVLDAAVHRAVDPAPPPKTEQLKQAEFVPPATVSALPPAPKPTALPAPVPKSVKVDSSPPKRTAPGPTTPHGNSGAIVAPNVFATKPPPPVTGAPLAAIGTCARDCSEGCTCSTGRACRGADCPAHQKSVAVQQGERAGQVYGWHDCHDYPGYQAYGFIDPADGQITSYERPMRFRLKPAPPQATGLAPAPLPYLVPNPPPILQYGAPVYYQAPYCTTGNCPYR